jgi:hypothetical protein
MHKIVSLQMELKELNKGENKKTVAKEVPESTKDK